MLLAIIYVGFAQSLFAAILILQKRPLHIADKILAFLLLIICYLFAINVVEYHHNLTAGIWPLMLSGTMILPTLLNLYSKYTIQEYSKFERKDLLSVIIPFFLTIILALIFVDKNFNNFYEFIDNINKLIFLRNFIGLFFVLNLWIGCLSALKNIREYKKKINNLYSYHSGMISLRWLQILIIILFVVFNIHILVSSQENKEFFGDIKIMRELILLVFVYVTSIWGYKQIQLDTGSKVVLNTDIDLIQTNSSEKYQKSGLKDDQAKEYMKQLIQYVEKSEIWKDNELSVARLSQLTNIPKHYITQVLNEYLKKNFYNFINEYRIEHAKILIKSPEYKTWSFVSIAFECGFNSKSAFNIFFKKYTGKTPSEYKKECSFTTTGCI